MPTTTLIRGLHNIKPSLLGGVVTIGNFDGVHLGHQQLVSQVIKRAQAMQVPSLVLTFEPHPFEFFAAGQVTIPRLTRLREKFCAIADCSPNAVMIMPFNQKLADISASDFVENILVEKLKIKHIIIGDDFRFGYQRQGDYALLVEMGQQYGFTVEAMPTVLHADERISSTRVRKALADNDLELAETLLGRPYAMQGRVMYGNQLGRVLGFPTANIFLHRALTPVQGVYTVRMHGLSNQVLPGVANVGTRPTVDGTRSLLEVHLLHFNQDIYRRYVCVEFCSKLREEERFPTLELLRDKIADDVRVAEAYFQQLGEL